MFETTINDLPPSISIKILDYEFDHNWENEIEQINGYIRNYLEYVISNIKLWRKEE